MEYSLKGRFHYRLKVHGAIYTMDKSSPFRAWHVASFFSMRQQSFQDFDANLVTNLSLKSIKVCLSQWSNGWKHVKQSSAKITRRLYTIFICSFFMKQNYFVFVLNCIFTLWVLRIYSYSFKHLFVKVRSGIVLNNTLVLRFRGSLRRYHKWC